MPGRIHHLMNRVFAFTATMMLVVPAPVLPCFADECRVVAESEDATCGSSCCAAPSDGVGAVSTGSQEVPIGTDPCECPPTCPAACGAGKAPCPPIQITTHANALMPALGLPANSEPLPQNPPGEGVFHPPRI